MNRFEKIFGGRREAKVRYVDGDFHVMAPGEFVRCAVTGQPIDLPELRYWSVPLQEAYASAEISLKRTLERKEPTSKS
ncbi:MAG: DUF2093 domain-containing protein [Hyphomicrobium sp.]